MILSGWIASMLLPVLRSSYVAHMDRYMPTFPYRVMILTVLLITAGCATEAKIEKLYQNPDAPAAPYQQILVIGIAAEPDQRRWMENLITEELADQDVSATPGYTRLGSSPVLRQDDVDLAAEATRSDAILIAHLVSVSEEVEIADARTSIKSECRGGNPIDYFLYDHEEIREPGSVSIAREVTMVSNLYDARSGARVWTVQSTCFEKSAFEAILNKEARAVVQQLRRDRLIRPTM